MILYMLANGFGCREYCTQVASGPRMEATPDQMLTIMLCVVGMAVFFIAGVMDITLWVEKERERKKKAKGK